MNIYDIAEKCGVSIATVSRVLNNNPNVSATTRARILAVMEEENYTPSALARSLGTGGTEATTASATSLSAVGVICTDLTVPRNAAVVAAVEAHLHEEGKAVRLSGNADVLADWAGRVETVVYIDPVARPDANDPIAAIASTTPVVVVEGYVNAPNVSCVRTDVRGAVVELIQHILRRQRRRILLLVGGHTCACTEMMGGYEDAYAAAGLPVDSELIIPVENTPEQVNTCLKRLLINRVTFDAVLCTDAVLALSAQKALQRTGLNLPIIGLTDALAARCSSPALTCADCDVDVLCAAVCDAIDKLPAAGDTLIPTHLNERDTFRNA